MSWGICLAASLLACPCPQACWTPCSVPCECVDGVYEPGSLVVWDPDCCGNVVDSEPVADETVATDPADPGDLDALDDSESALQAVSAVATDDDPIVTEPAGFRLPPALGLSHLALDWGLATIGAGTLFPTDASIGSYGGGFPGFGNRGSGPGGSSGGSSGGIFGSGYPLGNILINNTNVNYNSNTNNNANSNSNNNTNNNNNHNHDDDPSPVPEPVSGVIWLVGLGSLGLGALRRRSAAKG